MSKPSKIFHFGNVANDVRAAGHVDCIYEHTVLNTAHQLKLNKQSILCDKIGGIICQNFLPGGRLYLITNRNASHIGTVINMTESCIFFERNTNTTFKRLHSLISMSKTPIVIAK